MPASRSSTARRSAYTAASTVLSANLSGMALMKLSDHDRHHRSPPEPHTRPSLLDRRALAWAGGRDADPAQGRDLARRGCCSGGCCGSGAGVDGDGVSGGGGEAVSLPVPNLRTVGDWPRDAVRISAMPDGIDEPLGSHSVRAPMVNDIPPARVFQELRANNAPRRRFPTLEVRHDDNSSVGHHDMTATPDGRMVRFCRWPGATPAVVVSACRLARLEHNRRPRHALQETTTRTGCVSAFHAAAAGSGE